jgi:hypothetical protein
VEERQVNPQRRIAIFFALGGLLIVADALTGFRLGLVIAWGAITIARASVMAVFHERPEARWCNDARLAAATLVPYVPTGIGGAVLGLGSSLGPFPAIAALAGALVIGSWSAQYLLGEMVCTGGVWHSRERWMDPPVSDETTARWTAEQEARRQSAS